MAMIQNILFPVDFSPACVAMAPFVQRAAALLSAKVTLVHAFDPTAYNSFELYVRPLPQVEEERRNLAQEGSLRSSPPSFQRMIMPG